MAAPLDHSRNVLVSELRADVAPAEKTPPEGGTPSEPSFEALYDRWFDDVSRWVRALGAGEADRDDLVQEVFVLAFRRFASFDGENPAGWLYQIARRKVRDYRSLSWVRHFITVDTLARFEHVLEQTRTPYQELETSERSKILNRLLDTLSDDKRAAFVLFEIEGRSGEEIARAQNVPVNTVWARIYQARQKLMHEARRLEVAPLRQPRRRRSRHS